jgi:hypothetical protein
MNTVLMNKGLFRLLGVGLALCCVFAGCATQRTMVVGLSPDMEDYYNIYPSIEFDAMALTEEEAAQIKSEGVDKYFAPGSLLRKKFDPFTVYFSQERTLPETLPFRSAYWDRWLKKKPVTLVLIANLPHSPDMPEDDPRILSVDLKKKNIFPRPVYVEIGPEKITRVSAPPRDPRTDLPAERRRPDNRETESGIHGESSMDRQNEEG